MDNNNFNAAARETLNRAFQYYWTVIMKLGHKWTPLDTALGESVKRITKQKSKHKQ